jgi:hypothetical protein
MKNILRKALDSENKVKSILNKYFDGKTVRSLKKDEKLDRGFSFKAATKSGGIVEYNGIRYDYFVIDGKLHVISESQMKSEFNNNASEFIESHTTKKAKDSKKYVLEFTGYEGMSGPIYKDTTKNVYFEDINGMPPYDELADIAILSPSNDPDGEPDYTLSKSDYMFTTFNDTKGEDAMFQPFEVAKYKGQWALYSKVSQTFDAFGTKKEMEEKAKRMNAKYGKQDVKYDFQKEGYTAKAEDGSINFSYSEDNLPTYIYEGELIDDDEEMDFTAQFAYEQAEDMVATLNGEIRDEANKIIDELEDQVADSSELQFDMMDIFHELQYIEDFFQVNLVTGYYYGFSMILEFDDIRVDGISTEQRQNAIERLKSVAASGMKRIADELGMYKAKSGGWTGPVKVEDAMDKDFFGAKQGSEEADDILFALQAHYGKPNFGYDDFKKMNLTQVDVNKAIKSTKKDNLNKHSYFKKKEKAQDANGSDFPDFEGPEVYELDGIEIIVSTHGNEISKQSVKLAVANLIKTDELNSDIVDHIAIFEGYIYIKSKNEKQIKSGNYRIAATAVMALKPDGTTSKQFGKHVLEPMKAQDALANQNQLLAKKAQDSSDIQQNIEVGSSLARALFQQVEFIDNNEVLFKYEGGDVRITLKKDITDLVTDYITYEDEFEEKEESTMYKSYDDYKDYILERIKELKDEIYKDLIGEDAFLEIWL